ncbi:Conserved_hypothetical protein [Hexamita inflata]|uniref:Uncharacterized protein n=1 Tax=Hexamita inflata TaxID=28002 RepID=A0AA86R8C3_9EUKA|nr:Conserved hypothetical protein [Hexamita inflata]
MQARCDEYFQQGHFQSAFSLLTARCDHFNYSEHLDEIIAKNSSKLSQLETPVETFVKISQRINGLQDTIEKLKQDTIKSQSVQRAEVQNLISCCTQFQEAQQIQQNVCNSKELLKLIHKCINDILSVQAAVDEHSKIVSDLDTQIATVERSDSNQIVNNLSVVHRQLSSLVSLRVSIQKLCDLEQRDIPKLKALGIEIVLDCEQKVSELKQRLLSEIFIKVGNNWLLMLKKQSERIGEQHMRSTQQISVSFSPQLPLLLNLQQIQIPQSTPPLQSTPISPDDLMSTHYGLYYEIFENAKLLNLSEPFQNAVQSKWARSLTSLFSIDQIIFAQNFKIFYQIIGQFSIKILEEKELEVYCGLLQVNFENFCAEIQKLPLKQRQKLNSCYDKENGSNDYEKTVNFHLKLKKEIYKFIELLKQTEFKHNYEIIQATVQKALFDFFLQEIGPKFGSSQLQLLFAQFSQELKQLKPAQLEKTKMCLNLNMNIFKALSSYIVTVSSWLDPRLEINPYSHLQLGLLKQKLPISFGENEILTALNEVFFPFIQSEFDVLIQNGLQQQQFCVVAQAYNMLSPTMLMLAHYVHEAFQIETKHFDIYQQLSQNKFYQIMDREIDTLFIKAIQTKILKLDVQNRYSSKKQDEIDGLLQQLANELTQDLHFLPLQYRSVLFQKQLKIQTASVLLKVTSSIIQPYITSQGATCLIKDLNQIQGQMIDFEMPEQNWEQLKELLIQDRNDLNQYFQRGQKNNQLTPTAYQQIAEILIIEQIFKYKVTKEISMNNILMKITEQCSIYNEIHTLVTSIVGIFGGQTKFDEGTLTEVGYTILQRIKVSGHSEKNALAAVFKNIKKK